MAIVETAEAGLRAAGKGATVIQLRAPGRPAAELEREAARLAGKLPVVLVSSRCDIALAAGLQGVNLPENDISVADARWLLGTRFVGRSVHSIEAARVAEAEGADYVIVGPIWASPTHPNRMGLGVATLSAVAKAVRIPVLAIGGVDIDSSREALAAGAGGYAGIRMFQ